MFDELTISTTLLQNVQNCYYIAICIVKRLSNKRAWGSVIIVDSLAIECTSNCWIIYLYSSYQRLHKRKKKYTDIPR